MEESSLPAAVQAFLLERMESYEQLEILLLLRTRQSDSWAAGAVGSELHMPESVAQQALRALYGHGLLNVEVLADGQLFRYAPENAELAALVEKLAGAYGDHRTEVMRLMTANSIERLRARALQAFASALLLGKKAAKDD